MTGSISKNFNEAANPRPEKKPPQTVTIRLTAEERALLEYKAGDFTLSAYIRLCLFGDEVPKCRTRGKKVIKDHEALALVLSHLARSNIANNLNQLAKAANSGTLPKSPQIALYLKEARDHVIAIRLDLLRALGFQE
jgi:hypothetical protein